MRRAVFTSARALFAAGAACMLGVAMLAAPAAGSTSVCASSAGKCFAVSVSPSAPPAGGTVSFAFTVTNEAPTQQIGSFQITAPATFVLTGASAPSPATASYTSSSALFANLSVAPSASISVTVTAILPCSSNSYTWPKIQVKQSNDFSGLPGNDFQPDPASAGNLAGTPSGSCSLAFTSDGQPNGTAVSQVIHAGFGSSGGFVKVAVLDASGQTIANPAETGLVAVTVAIGSNPGSGKLLGTTTVQASGGIASFSDLSIDHSSPGYTLTATTTSPGIAGSGPSADFTIFGSLQHCAATPCSSKLSSATTTGTVTTPSVAPSEFLGTGVGGASYSCATYQSFSDPFSFDVYGSSGTADPNAQFSGVLDISKSTVQASGRSKAASWQLCYASTEPFTALPGTYTPSTDPGASVIGGVPFNTGLLPDCSSTQGAPCVQTRAKGSGGDVLITFLASGDPLSRG